MNTDRCLSVFICGCVASEGLWTVEIPLLPQRASRYKYKYNHGSMEMARAFHRCFREGTYGIQISKKVSSDCRNRRPDADSASERASCRARITSRTRRHGVGEVYTDRPQCILQLLGKGLRTARTREEIRWRFCSRRFGPCARRQTEPAGRAVLAGPGRSREEILAGPERPDELHDSAQPVDPGRKEGRLRVPC